MSAKLVYTYEDLMADQGYASRVYYEDRLYHGGLDAEGNWISPRSLCRMSAVEAWTNRLVTEENPVQVMGVEDLPSDYFPNIAQAKFLLQHGAKTAISSILTLIGVVEGFGNVGLQRFPRDPLQPFFVEDLTGTCLAHLDALFTAHGHDEAGSDYKGRHECGHDEMWYIIRDAALENPPVPEDVYSGLSLGTFSNASSESENTQTSENAPALVPLVEGIPPVVDALVQSMMRLLAIELAAFTTFQWASEVLGDPACSAEPDFAARSVGYIQDDETVHVSYLQCALSEIRCRTVIGVGGEKISGRSIVDEALQRVLRDQDNSRRQQSFRFRMRKIKEDLALLPQGDKLLVEFSSLGPVPEVE